MPSGLKKVDRRIALNEEILVGRMKAGDKDAFDKLYDKYKNMALHTAYLITGNLTDSEDIVQDTFVKVFLHCTELKNDGGFKAWMMQILVRTAYKSGKKKSREVPDEEVIEKADTRTKQSLLEQVLERETEQQLSEAIRGLPLKQRTVVILFYYQEYSVSEIAKICGCLEGTVKSRLHSARTQLKRKLERSYYAETV